MLEHQYWRHKASGELWAVRLEDGKVTGYMGALFEQEVTPENLPNFDYDCCLSEETKEECAEWWSEHGEEYTLHEP